MIIPAAFIAALIAVESGGNDAAVGYQGELGCLQIKMCVIVDVNATLRRPTFYKPKDRLNRAASMQILRRYLARWATVEHLGRKPTLRDMALIWHRGPDGWRKPDKDRYWVRVQKAMRKPAPEPHSKGP